MPKNNENSIKKTNIFFAITIMLLIAATLVTIANPQITGYEIRNFPLVAKTIIDAQNPSPRNSICEDKTTTVKIEKGQGICNCLDEVSTAYINSEENYLEKSLPKISKAWTRFPEDTGECPSIYKNIEILKKGDRYIEGQYYDFVKVVYTTCELNLTTSPETRCDQAFQIASSKISPCHTDCLEENPSSPIKKEILQISQNLCEIKAIRACTIKKQSNE